MTALAFCNNDVAVFAWSFGRRLDGCLGFAVYRDDGRGGWTPLPALARFEGVPPDATQTTEQAPVQKFWWKDLGAKRGSTRRYRVVPLGGAPGSLAPLPGVDPLETGPVTLTPERGPFRAYFNRGIVATQMVAHALGDSANVDALLARIRDPADPLRQALAGQIVEGLTALLDRADAGGGEIRAALYELNDPNGLERRLQAADGRGRPGARHVILGNERESANKKAGTPAVADKYAANREKLHGAGVAVTDRILPADHIPHNKFMVLRQGGIPAAVLTGSTNWTMTGVATQTNNALVVESPALAAAYDEYWDRLKQDSDAAASGGHWQSQTLRTWCRDHNAERLAQPIPLEDGSARATPLFMPSTHTQSVKGSREQPADIEHVFALMRAATQSILFLAFDPGNTSILDVAGQVVAKNPGLFVRGVVTSAERATNFAVQAQATVVGESGDPARKGEIDSRVVPAGNVGPRDVFGTWEAEIAKAGHAIVHDKIVVVDPFGPDPVVVTGSHNLGYRASHNNDENMLVVRGHRGLAEAYACHVLDLYDHYAWRWWLRQRPATFGRPLDGSDAWQDRYLRGGAPTSPELRFWLSGAATG